MASRQIELTNEKRKLHKWFDEYLDKWSSVMDEHPGHECFSLYHQMLAKYANIESELLTLQAADKLKAVRN